MARFGDGLWAGVDLLDAVDRDLALVRSELGAQTVAGFLAGGELGPVAGPNCPHGFTASLLALPS